MKRIKFIRKLNVFLKRNQRLEYHKLRKLFKPLIEKLPVNDLDEKYLKEEFYLFCENHLGYTSEESRELYSRINNTTDKLTGRPMPGIKSNIELFNKKGFKVTSTKPFQGGSPGLGKNK